MMRVEPGQQCDHPLEAVGRHRVCRECAAVYMAVAGPNEVVLLGGYAAVLALHDEYRALSAAHQQPAGSATLAATIEAQRDTELAKMQAARPYSALHSYHEGREEAFSSVLEALAASPRPQEPAGDRSVGEERR